MRDVSRSIFDAADADSPGPDPLIGRTLAGKFAIEGLLGSGSMGTVYRARQVALDKPVAVKVLNRDLATQSTLVGRFRSEARAASLLDHPNSIRVFDFGEEPDGLLYLAMELVDGQDLRALLVEHGMLPAPRIVDIVSQILAALAVAHDVGILHRDLKPENIMIVQRLGDEGRQVDIVKVCDFGIAKILNPESNSKVEAGRHHTTAGMVVGTPEYMSPEQVRGQAVDGRSDLYAVGALLYELLAGRPPFEAEGPLDVALKQISDIPAPPSSRALGVDPRLEAVCLKALEKRPADRFQNAREMRGAVRATLDVRPTLVSVAPAASAAETPPPTKPTLDGVTPLTPTPAPRSWARLAAPVLAAAMGVIAIVALQRQAGHRPPATLDPVRAPVSAAIVAAPAPAPAPAAAIPLEPAVDSARPAITHAPAHDAKPSHRSVQAPAAPSADPNKVAEVAAKPPEIAAKPPEVLLGLEPHPPVEAAPLPPPASPPAAAATFAPAPATALAPAAAYDLASASVDVGPANNTVGVTSLNVIRAVTAAQSQLARCYRAALPTLAAPIEGRGRLDLETDGTGVVTAARLVWGSDAGIAGCIAGAMLHRRVANVDTGAASASVALFFKAH